MNDPIDTMLENTRPHLSTTERAELFERIEAAVTLSVPSPYSYFLFSKTVAAIVVLVSVAGISGTVLAAEAAKPGDLLFPIERAREEVTLVFASDEEKAVLKEQFAAERFTELQDILEEERKDGDTDTFQDGGPRVEAAVAVLIDYVSSIEDESKRAAILRDLDQELGRGQQRDDDFEDEKRVDDSSVEIKSNRIEIKNDTSEIRIEDDGEVRIKYEDDDYKFESRENESEDDDAAYVSIKKFEVRVKEDKAEIRIEYGNNKLEYDARLTSEEAILEDVSDKTGISVAELSSALDIEFDD